MDEHERLVARYARARVSLEASVNVEHWFNIFTYRRGAWVTIIIPQDDHLWDLLIALRTKYD